MTARLMLAGRALVPLRFALVAASLSVLVGLAIAQLLAGGSAPPVTAPAGAHEAQTALPAAARGAVSGALGAADGAYAVTAAGGVLRAHNAAQRLQIGFGVAGVTLSGRAPQLGIGLHGVGYGDTSSSLAAVGPRAHGNRVLYRRPGVTEWYANGPLGLEQGFTVSRPPAGDRSLPLTLSMALSGPGGHAAMAAGGESVLLGAPGRPALRYGDLSATDAQGRSLRSWLALREGNVLLRVDARGARYPLHIDPLVQEGNRLTVSGEEAPVMLGFSVALSADGRTALVGAPSADHFEGAVWVFVRSGGAWVQQGSKLTGSASGKEEAGCGSKTGEATGECGFGRSISLSADGDTAIVGAPRKTGPCPSEAGECPSQGVAFVFHRSGSSWTLQSMLTGGSEEGAEGRFGRSVAISSDGATALVGAPADRAGAGAAWVFTRAPSGSTWTRQGGRLTGEEEVGAAHFGGSVALSGDGGTALVGGPGDSSFTGAAWLFTRSGSTWEQRGQKLTGAGEEVGEGHFASSLALSADGTTALMGARADNGGAGAVWPFTRSEGALVHQGPKLTGGAEAVGVGEFGFSVGLSADGNTALIGAPYDNAAVGAAWLFKRSPSAWNQEGSKLTGIGGTEEARKGAFGWSVAMRSDGERALIGAPTDSGRLGAVWAFADPALLPAVTGISPHSGPVSGGTSVNIVGTRLTGVGAVNFDDAPATSFTINPDGSITAISPPRSGLGASNGVVHVTVTTDDGTTPIGPANRFTYVQQPAVNALSPAEGATAGATAVTITGSHLGEAVAVRFGSADATSFEVTSPTSITAISPPAAAATVHVTVTTPGGTSNETARDRFSFVPEAVGPPGGTPGGGTSGGAVAGGGTAAAGGSGGVLGFGPACTPSLVSRTITVLSRGRAAVKVRWRGAGTCKGRLRLTLRIKSGKKTKTTVIATGSFTLASGKARTITVKLNAAGRARLSAAHGRLGAGLTFVNATPGATPASSANVRLIIQKVTGKAKAPAKSK